MCPVEMLTKLDSAILKVYPPFAKANKASSDKIPLNPNWKTPYCDLVHAEDVVLEAFSQDDICDRTITLRKRGALPPVLGGHGRRKKA